MINPFNTIKENLPHWEDLFAERCFKYPCYYIYVCIPSFYLIICLSFQSVPVNVPNRGRSVCKVTCVPGTATVPPNRSAALMSADAAFAERQNVCVFRCLINNVNSYTCISCISRSGYF